MKPITEPLTREAIVDPVTREPVLIHAVVDTNTIVSIYSWHDLGDRMMDLHLKGNEPDFADPLVAFKCKRAETTFRLALYLHQAGLRTYSPDVEIAKILLNKCPPECPPDDERERFVNSGFVSVFSHFIKDKLLYRWRDGCVEEIGRQFRTGREFDDHLIEFAAVNSLPLITLEGWSPNGYATHDRTQMPHRARARGVTAMLPEQFYAKEFDEAWEMQSFFVRFRYHAPKFLGGRKNLDDAGKNLQVVYDYYRRLADRDWS